MSGCGPCGQSSSWYFLHECHHDHLYNSSTPLSSFIASEAVNLLRYGIYAKQVNSGVATTVCNSNGQATSACCNNCL